MGFLSEGCYSILNGNVKVLVTSMYYSNSVVLQKIQLTNDNIVIYFNLKTMHNIQLKRYHSFV